MEANPATKARPRLGLIRFLDTLLFTNQASLEAETTSIYLYNMILCSHSGYQLNT
jgi:hypothetical protein